MSDKLAAANVLVTGSEGFLGKHLVRHLEGLGANVRRLPHDKADLTIPAAAYTAVLEASWERPLDFVFHLAGFNGGIEFNRQRPADIFHDNTLMALNLVEACVARNVGKFVGVVASCAYGDTAAARSGVLHEDDFFAGRPNETVAGHGFAKRNLQLACQFYRQQHNLNAVCVCPTTLYGPGDSFDPERTKVMGGMIRRFVEARRKGLDKVEVWGTGRPLREFLHVADCARLMADAALKYDDSALPLNLGTGQEVSIASLATMVAEAAGYQGEIHFDTSKPDGQYRKRLDMARLWAVLGPDQHFTPLDEGIRETVRWYEENYRA